MTIFTLILAGIILYFAMYKLFIVGYRALRQLCTKYIWVKIVCEYIEAGLLLLCLLAPAAIGIIRYQQRGFDDLVSLGITLTAEIAIGIFCLGFLFVYLKRK